METNVSFWLIPSEQDKVYFQEIINSLAREYDAPTFTPHVTVYFGECTADESPAELLEAAIRGVRGFSLRVDKLLYSNEYTKTLFVQFHPNSILSQISETLRSNSKKPSNYSLNPHLSLIYQYLSETTQEKLATELKLPQSEVLFDEVQAISTSKTTQRREDVESWQVICSRKLL